MSIYKFDSIIKDADRLPSHATWAYPKDGEVFDEEMSVRWNREKCRAEQERWHQESKQLREHRAEKLRIIKDEIVKYIIDEINVSPAAARKIWEIADWNLDKCDTLMDEYITIKELDV